MERSSVILVQAVTTEMIRQAGVVGAGGAGFPTHIKFASGGSVDSVLLNAAECEPLLHKDKEILGGFGPAVIEGFAAAVRLSGAKQAVIGIKEKYKDIIAALKPLLGPGMSIAPLADIYPAGDEFMLVYNTLGRIVPPGGIPLMVGAVVLNVETALNIAGASNTPVVEKFISVAGAVARPITLRVPVGVTLAQCIAAAGGPVVDDPNLIVGGTMMGYLESNPDALVDKTTGAVIVLPSDHVVVRKRRGDWTQISRIGRSACDQCCFCTELCPRYLLGHPVEPHRTMRNLGFNLMGEANVMGASFCCECNLCSMYSCPEGLDPKNVCREHKRRLVKEGKKWTSPPLNSARAAMHMLNRQAPMRRLMRRLDLLKYNNAGPLVKESLPAARVGIKLKQHVGVACEPVVAVGQTVRRCDVVGQIPVKDGKPVLGAPVHASIDGVVRAIADGVIWIEGT